MEYKNIYLLSAAALLSIMLVLSFVLAIQPSGGTVTPGTPETAAADAAGTADAYAGNVTELSVNGFTTTPTWQGYFGNVTGVIQLADASDKVMYNWTSASPRGEVYASTNQSIFWTNIQCLNYTANGSYANETGNGGTTNLAGLNLSTLETRFNISTVDVDGVNETFTLTGAGTHDTFFTASQQFSEGECISTRIYDNTGAGVSNKFEEVLLYEPRSYSLVFTSILDQDAAGFDTKTHDFEMLVLENGHGNDVAATPYYFFVELE